MLVSTLPTWSFKNFKVRREVVLPLLISVGAYAALLVGEPWAALAAAGLIYIGMVPFSILSYIRLKREAEELLQPVPATEAPAEGA
jgi:CDP-diacylglycerol--serine O-phosphatidyltransferase